MKTIHAKPGQVIVVEGDESNDAYIILDGEIEVTKRSRHLATLKENAIFGEISMVDNRPRTATCTAKTACTLGMVTRDNYKQLLSHRPDAINPLLQYYQSSPKLIYRSGETALEKKRPIELLHKPQGEAPPYIVSVSPISKTKTDS